MGNKFLVNIEYQFSETLIYEIDLNYIITYANKSFCNVVSYREDEVIGKNNIFYKHPDVPKERYEKLWNINYSNNRKNFFTLKNIRRDGFYFWSNIFTSPKYSKDNKLQGHIIIHREASKLDITEEEYIYNNFKNKR